MFSVLRKSEATSKFKVSSQRSTESSFLHCNKCSSQNSWFWGSYVLRTNHILKWLFLILTMREVPEQVSHMYFCSLLWVTTCDLSCKLFQLQLFISFVLSLLDKFKSDVTTRVKTTLIYNKYIPHGIFCIKTGLRNTPRILLIYRWTNFEQNNKWVELQATALTISAHQMPLIFVGL